MNYTEIQAILGNVDIYLIDQILKNRYAPSDTILDAGCGEGRNLKWFYANNYKISGIDTNKEHLEIAKILYPKLIPNFQVGSLDALPYGENKFYHIICCAVLHFAQSEKQFTAMFSELVRVLKPKGTLFIRMTSDIGIEKLVQPISDGVCKLPDEAERFLLTRALITEMVITHKLSFLEPIKTVNVDDRRCMTTLMLQRCSLKY